jgi:hypothetical protein
MSATCVPRRIQGRIERRTRLQSWGIEIETWQLLETRTLPNECALLPLSTIFADAHQGAMPSRLTEDDDTLETPLDEITRENELAPEYAELEITTEHGAVVPARQEGGVANAGDQTDETTDGGGRHDG